MSDWKKQAEKIWATLDRVSIDLEALKKQTAETEKILKEQSAETNRILTERFLETDRRFSSIGINFGGSAEDFFYNSLEKEMKLGNISFDKIKRNMHRHKKNLQDEFDIVMFNGASIGLVEVKYRARLIDIENLIQHKSPNFKKLFPQYNRHSFFLGIATMTTDPSILKEAKKLGVAILQQRGETVHIYGKNLRAY